MRDQSKTGQAKPSYIVAQALHGASDDVKDKINIETWQRFSHRVRQGAMPKDSISL